MKTRYLAAALLVSVAAVAAFRLAGSVVVRDPEYQLESARVLTSDGRTQSLHRFPGGVFYAAPKLEGDIELHCRTGAVRRMGYVTPHTHETLRITSSHCHVS